MWEQAKPPRLSESKTLCTLLCLHAVQMSQFSKAALSMFLICLRVCVSSLKIQIRDS
jgi:hypothetical protein